MTGSQVNCSPSSDHDDCRDVAVIVMSTVVASHALNFRFPCVDLVAWLAAFDMAQAHSNDTERPFDMLRKINVINRNFMNANWRVFTFIFCLSQNKMLTILKDSLHIQSVRGTCFIIRTTL